MTSLETESGSSVDVSEMGAVGDEVSDDTGAIQMAIDLMADAGGGRVRFGGGTYLCSSLRLRSGVTLELDQASTLLAHPDAERYVRDDDPIYPDTTALAWIWSEQQSRVGIVGSGVIDGNGAAFGDVDRPRVLVLDRCDQVRLDGVTFKDSASWMIHLSRCDGVTVSKLTISSRVKRNNDGIDLDSCRNVTISDCRIDCGDDAIAFKTNHEEPCSNITVSNCVLGSDWAAFRLGPESRGDFTNIAVSNCVVTRAWGNGVKLQMAEGASLRNISFSNIVMDEVTGPIMIRLAGWRFGGIERAGNDSWRNGVLKDVTFSEIRARVTNQVGRHESWDDERFSAISITGLPEMKVAGLRFRGLHVSFPGHGTPEHAVRHVVDEHPEKYPEYLMFGVLPAYALYMHHVEDVSFDNATFELRDEDHRSAVVVAHSEDVEFHRLRAARPAKEEPLVRLFDSRSVHFQHPPPELAEYLDIQGDCEDLTLGPD